VVDSCSDYFHKAISDDWGSGGAEGNFFYSPKELAICGARDKVGLAVEHHDRPELDKFLSVCRWR
jgi:hypothetical protein